MIAYKVNNVLIDGIDFWIDVIAFLLWLLLETTIHWQNWKQTLARLTTNTTITYHTWEKQSDFNAWKRMRQSQWLLRSTFYRNGKLRFDSVCVCPLCVTMYLFRSNTRHISQQNNRSLELLLFVCLLLVPLYTLCLSMQWLLRLLWPFLLFYWTYAFCWRILFFSLNNNNNNNSVSDNPLTDIQFHFI